MMPIDSDDLVSNRFAEFFKNKDDGKCYMSKFGYIWRQGSAYLTKHKDLSRTCGSCAVTYYNADELPSTDYEHRDEKRKYIFQTSHRDLPRYAKSLGKFYGVIPFPTTVYVLGTGDNHSILRGTNLSWKRKLEGIIKVPRPISEGMRNEFNIKQRE